MKIILEPTENLPANLMSPRVELTVPSDISLADLVVHIRGALVAWGYPYDVVAAYLPEID